MSHFATDSTYTLCFQGLSGSAIALLSLVRIPDNTALLEAKPSLRPHPLTCSAGVPKQNDLRNFLMTEEGAAMARIVTNLVRKSDLNLLPFSN